VAKQKGAAARDAPAVTVLARNRKARHEYQVVEAVEAGLALVGSEVKSIRAGKANLTDAFADVQNNEAWLHQMDISGWAFAHTRNHEARRRRKLLLHRNEIDRLAGKLRAKGYTLVPLSLYDKGGKIKIELALVEGKQDWDRRDDIKKREAQRDMERAMVGKIRRRL
jgi:SsrA-binding protein